ncbi:6-phosphofructo-2-kinase/fructose-2,6-bisphosphatase [Desulfogranum marinum]|uniref:bifunctional nucleoside/nucleotide kinase/histidine phosphatase family protein n=1 Tax=Desulfogranum marinum TaxID=453220 RepID=UPI0029C91ED0|nr:6-phosphofructo-2-kinase/fructose-2,6-bisphosphatase [Desulfogranum marinum]
MNRKLVIVMMGLPARGKSTMARKLSRTLELDGVKSTIFNNGDLRRRMSEENTSSSIFFSPGNPEGVAFREKISSVNIENAHKFLREGGCVAILDASNVTRKRRRKIQDTFSETPLLFIECMNADDEALEANLERKAGLSEFSDRTKEEAIASFLKRIKYYESIYEPLDVEPNRILVDSFESCILQEQASYEVPYYDRIRDILTTRVVRNLFLVRHGETFFNVEDRIGGNSELTDKGFEQAKSLAEHFATQRIPIIFTSNYKRTLQTAETIRERQDFCSIIALPEFNEIHGGVCEGMTYKQISEQMPHVARARRLNKYNYIYPEGEGYKTMEERVHRGLKKVFYLNNYDENIMIVGHKAVNRMILSKFLSRQEKEIPYIYMPQNRYYHIQINPHKRIFELIPYHTASV